MSNTVSTLPAQRGASWEQRRGAAQQRNVSEHEQMLSLVAGAGLALYGLGRGSWLGIASVMVGASLLYRGWTGYCSTYDLLGINRVAGRRERPGVRARHGRKVTRVIRVDRDRRDVYDFWRNLENLPRVMRHLESVKPTDATRSQWIARGPMGKTLRWEAEIITDRPGEAIAWQSLPGSEVDTAGSVHFNDAPSGGGTEVVISLKYDPPGGQVATNVADWLGVGLEKELDEDLRRWQETLRVQAEPSMSDGRAESVK